MTSGSEGERIWEKIEEVADRVYHPQYFEYGVGRTTALTKAIATMDDAVTTELNVQKFTDRLRANGVPILGPKPLYLGGFWSFADHRVLLGLKRIGVLSTRASPFPNVDAPTYAVNPDYIEDLWIPDRWRGMYENFKRKFNLRSIFDDHDRKVVKQLVLDTDRYIGRDRNLFEQARHGDLAVDVELIKDEVSYNEPMGVTDTDAIHKPFVATEYHLVDEYKHIPTKEVREKETPYMRWVRRKFSVEFIWRHYNQGANLQGEVVFLFGYRDVSKSSITQPNIWHLRPEPAADKTIPVEFDGQLDGDIAELTTNSLGVLGFLDIRQDKPVVRAFALLKYGQLPHELLREQRGQMVQDLYGTVPKLIDDHKRIRSDIEQIETSIEELVEAANLTAEQESAVAGLLSQLRGMTDDVGRIKLLAEFAERHEELEWIVAEILRYIS